MNKPNRSKYEIIGDICNTVMDGHKRITHLMQTVNMSHEQANHYLPLCVSAGLLMVYEDERRPKYELTAKGYQYLQAYKNMGDFLASLDKVQKEVVIIEEAKI